MQHRRIISILWTRTDVRIPSLAWAIGNYFDRDLGTSSDRVHSLINRASRVVESSPRLRTIRTPKDNLQLLTGRCKDPSRSKSGAPDFPKATRGPRCASPHESKDSRKMVAIARLSPPFATGGTLTPMLASSKPTQGVRDDRSLSAVECDRAAPDSKHRARLSGMLIEHWDEHHVMGRGENRRHCGRNQARSDSALTRLTGRRRELSRCRLGRNAGPRSSISFCVTGAFFGRCRQRTCSSAQLHAVADSASNATTFNGLLRNTPPPSSAPKTAGLSTRRRPLCISAQFLAYLSK